MKSRDFHKMPIPEYEAEILTYYVNQLTGLGLYVTYDNARKIIDKSNHTSRKKQKLKRLLYLIAKNHGTKKLLDKVENGTITELGKLSTVLTDIRDIQKMGINPVTISRNMQKSIPNSELINAITGDSIPACILLNLVDIINAYNQQIKEEHQQGTFDIDDIDDLFSIEALK